MKSFPYSPSILSLPTCPIALPSRLGVVADDEIVGVAAHDAVVAGAADQLARLVVLQARPVLPPWIRSLPAPPQIMSRPPLLMITSLPPRPAITSRVMGALDVVAVLVADLRRPVAHAGRPGRGRRRRRPAPRIAASRAPTRVKERRGSVGSMSEAERTPGVAIPRRLRDHWRDQFGCGPARLERMRPGRAVPQP